MENIDWLDSKNHLLLNKKLLLEQQNLWQRAYTYALEISGVKGHIFLLTSGTSGNQKLVALSKNAILCSSEAVNQHLQVSRGDPWLNPLPCHHIGGLSIYSRALLSKSPVTTLETWSAKTYYQFLENDSIAHSSLVPTQVYDLLELHQPCPPSVKTIVVGGAHLPNSLFTKAKTLGYPLLPSFGASELASQIATASVEEERLQILPHIHAKTNIEGKLILKSASLFSFYVQAKGDDFYLQAPSLDKDGYFITEDHARLTASYLEPLGRNSDYIKILGEAISLVRLEKDLEKEMDFSFCILSQAEARKGAELVFACESKDLQKALEVLPEWNRKCLGFERIHLIAHTSQMERTDLGKIKKAKLIQDIAKNNLSIVQV